MKLEYYFVKKKYSSNPKTTDKQAEAAKKIREINFALFIIITATVNGQPTGNGPFISGSVTTVPIDGASPNNTAQNREAKLREEVSKLKGDKLELLRQNMSAQRELKMLREREVQLQTDLTMASREIQRLHRNARANSSSHQQQP